MTRDVVWLRSSACESHACVMVAIVDDAVLVRQSDGGPVLSFTHDEWAAFTEGVRRNEFDVPER